MQTEKQKISIARPLLLTLLAGVFALGIFVGAGMGLFTPLPDTRLNADGNQEGFRFIKPPQEGKTASGGGPKKELLPFQDRVNELAASSVKNGEATAVFFYFRDLSGTSWFGSGEHEPFPPGSQLKVPLMIAYFKWAESNPRVLRTTLTYSAPEALNEGKQGLQEKALKPGDAYSVNNLIFRMITVDDGGAYALLRANLPAGRLEKIYKDLDVRYEDSLSLKACAAFYRALFNASYLSEEMSEKALRYLYKSASKEGMIKSLPPNIDMAGLYGERTIAAAGSDDEQEQYFIHEFGIIYQPNRPFLLGVTVRGHEVDRMKNVLREITRLIHQEVDRQS